MKYNKHSRRHFLQGVSGSIMALPFLPSLLSSKAYAQTVASQKFLVLVGSDHGGTGVNKDWFPGPFIDNPNSNIFVPTTLIPAGGQNRVAHNARSARLSTLLTSGAGHEAGNVDNGQQRLSFVLGSFLNPYLSKINMLVGIDGGMTNLGHSQSLTGGALSSFPESPNWPTLDHFLANSPKFYTNRSGISVPVINNSYIGFSWTNGGVKYPQTSGNLQGLYTELFSRYQNTNTTQENAIRSRRSFLMDRVLEDYNRLVNGNTGYARRISSEDKRRLASHAEHMFETERKYRVVTNTCSSVASPTINGNYWAGGSTNLTDYTRLWDVTTSLLAAAFSCGASRLANLAASAEYFLYSGDYHQEIAHQAAFNRTAEVTHNRNFRWQTEHLFAAVVRKLDGIDAGNGQTLLDKGVVVLFHEAGPTTHDQNSIGCVMAGSGDGYFRTGNFVDFRNLQNPAVLNIYNPNDPFLKAGVPVQRLNANILQAMGHIPSDYRRNGRPGYGSDQTAPPISSNGYYTYPVEMVNSFDTKLPIITT